MSAVSVVPDPFYQDSPAMALAWDLVELVGGRLILYPELGVPIGANRALYLLFIAPGLDIEMAYALVCRGILFLRGGTLLAPEFTEPLPKPLPRGCVGPAAGVSLNGSLETWNSTSASIVNTAAKRSFTGSASLRSSIAAVR